VQDVSLATRKETGPASERAKLEREAAEAGEALGDVSDAKGEEATSTSTVAHEAGDSDSDSEEERDVRVLARFMVNEMYCVAVHPLPSMSVYTIMPEHVYMMASSPRLLLWGWFADYGKFTADLDRIDMCRQVHQPTLLLVTIWFRA